VSDGERAARRAAALRLASLLAVLVAAFAAFWIFDLVDADDIRDTVEGFGPLAPLAYVVVAAALGAALVPGPILAGASGLLFGAALGTLVTLAAATLGAVLALHIARRSSGHAFTTLSGPRLQGLAGLAQRHALIGVIVARLAPVLPDAPVSYLFGVIGLRTWHVALGTAIGAAPRAFSYTSIGASLDDPGSPLALVGIAGVLLTGLVGLVLSHRLLRRSPRASRGRRRLRRSGAARGRMPPSGG
jgi:uncharacterized membrane protein YdjX (TVP38/TMEM64 family)